MELAETPKKVLGHIACVVSGFLFSVWCFPLFANRDKAKHTTDGFSIRLPMPHLANLNEAVKLRGKQVKLLRKVSDHSQWCLIDHPPLVFHIVEQSVILSASMDFFEAIPLKVSHSDFKSFRILGLEETRGVQTCSIHAKVTYGE